MYIAHNSRNKRFIAADANSKTEKKNMDTSSYLIETDIKIFIPSISNAKMLRLDKWK